MAPDQQIKLKSYRFTHECYAMALYHCLKHPAETVCGLFLGKIVKEGTTDTNNSNSKNSGPSKTNTYPYARFVRTVPLTHSHALSPTLKLAFISAEKLAEKEGLEILGFYGANKISFTQKVYGDNQANQAAINSSYTWLPLYKGIFEKLQLNIPYATAWLLDAKVIQYEEFPFIGFTTLNNQHTMNKNSTPAVCDPLVNVSKDLINHSSISVIKGVASKDADMNAAAAELLSDEMIVEGVGGKQNQDDEPWVVTKERAIPVTAGILKKRIGAMEHNLVCDWDDHLRDCSCDWTNNALNERLKLLD